MRLVFTGAGHGDKFGAMGYVQGWDRSQPTLLPECLDDYVSEDHPVRVIDAFVDGLEFHVIGMDCKQPGSVGRDGYDPRVLLKLYIYGYLNRIRSSRSLERETKRNLELIWLLGKRQPDHWTINDFRRRHAKAFRKVLREFNLLCMKVGLFGAELVALDGTFLKAVNSKARNYTGEKLRMLMARIDDRIAAYLEELERAEGKDAASDAIPESRNATAEAIDELRKKREGYEQLAAEAQKSETGQASLTDPDSRLLQKGGKSVVGYNGQIVVDGKHHLIVCAELTNAGNDLQQLEPMSRAAKEELGVEVLTTLADGGYHNLSQIAACDDAGIAVHSPQRQQKESLKEFFAVSSFEYEADTDRYRCPQGRHLHRHSDYASRGVTFRAYYNAAACRDCPARESCTKGRYRKLSIHEHAEVGERVARRMAESPQLYPRRQGLVEHVFGTLKSWWGYEGFLTRGLTTTTGEWLLGCLSYNFRRALNIPGCKELMAAIRG